MDRIINIGIDCEDNERWRSMLPKLSSESEKKLFTLREHSHCQNSKDPAIEYALTWCLKEAAVKALFPFYQINLKQIEIEFQKKSINFLLIDSEKLSRFKIRGDSEHTKNTSIAVVIVYS